MRDTPNIGDLTHKASLDETEFEEEEKDLNNCLELTNFINELQKCTDKTARELPQMRRCALMRLLEVLVSLRQDNPSGQAAATTTNHLFGRRAD